MSLEAIKKEVERHACEMNELVAKLRVHILSLPDNPNINRISPKCFTMSSKDLGSNWSPSHHDFKMQYEAVAGALACGNADSIVNKLDTIISTGRVAEKNAYGQSTGNFVKLHPNVVANLMKMTGKPPINCPQCDSKREWSEDASKAICHFCGRHQ